MITMPSAAFRKNSIKETSTEYRLYVKQLTKKFSWMGAFGTKEEAQKAASRQSKYCDQYIIKKVVVHYEEETCEMSSLLNMLEKLPELNGVF